MKAANTDSPQKQNIMNVAETLMLSKGFVATSIDLICKEAGITKGGFFHYFKNKVDLGKQLLVRFQENMAANLASVPGIDDSDPLVKLNAYLDAVTRFFGNITCQGCLVGTFVQEIHDSHPEMREVCEELIQKSIQPLAGLIEQVKAKYGTRLEVDSQSLAESIISLIQGATILKKSSKDPLIVKRSFESIRALINYTFNQ